MLYLTNPDNSAQGGQVPSRRSHCLMSNGTRISFKSKTVKIPSITDSYEIKIMKIF